VSPLLAEYAKRVRASVEAVGDVPPGTHTITLGDIVEQQEAAFRAATEVATVAPPDPTPEEMLATAVEWTNRCRFALGAKVWRKVDGKEARVIDIKFTPDGWPTYLVQYENAKREKHPVPAAYEKLSARRVYFPVDLTTGRNILPEVA
jgi:hypothetical protein